ncbi:hypothetical protein RRG08_000530 [Elysia crispata]|uniref:Integrase zinc-binding domain-containing protein n=1 Tax=Elysia crispata TaxID=231223 RepID=A0AAE1E5L9_9GAST|nr:hypothetical protein RRG08_000530 [Elysia crispata]
MCNVRCGTEYTLPTAPCILMHHCFTGNVVGNGPTIHESRNAKRKNRTDQLVVSFCPPELVLKGCHDIPIARHMAIDATKKRICSRFSWPGIMQDTTRFVKSCITFQKQCNKLPRLPAQQGYIVDRPFDKVAIDLMGPLTVTGNKCRHILTLVDTATRYHKTVIVTMRFSDHSSDEKHNTIRLYIDFRRLNRITVIGAEPIPTFEELASKLNGDR